MALLTIKHKGKPVPLSNGPKHDNWVHRSGASIFSLSLLHRFSERVTACSFFVSACIRRPAGNVGQQDTQLTTHPCLQYLILFAVFLAWQAQLLRLLSSLFFCQFNLGRRMLKVQKPPEPQQSQERPSDLYYMDHG